MPKKTGVLLLNVGTPSNPTVSGVRQYLREFLSDPRVLDMPYYQRMLLLYGLILPFRTRRSAKAYQKIWDEETGSPLLHHSRNLTLGLQAELGDEHNTRTSLLLGKAANERSPRRALLV
ncbi:MAG TPA: ferrochelatase, partial [Gammaproteobacteria bacterium]|nr:ferrochelatase [Gammaproteobacteria bacterium]